LFNQKVTHVAQAEAKRGIGERIVERALELLSQNPDGIRWAELVRLVSQDRSFKHNTITGNLYNLDQRFPGKVYKPARGLFRLLELRSRCRSATARPGSSATDASP